jgi:hypothetical protein
MTGLLTANHSSGHWALDFLLFMAPAIVFCLVLLVWQRRGR